MDTRPGQRHVIIAPQIYISMEAEESFDLNEEVKPRRTEIPMVWIQDGSNFRLDIDLPESSVLDVIFSPSVDSLHVNGETIWEHNTPHTIQRSGVHVEIMPAGLRLTCTYSGSIHILARCVTQTILHK